MLTTSAALNAELGTTGQDYDDLIRQVSAEVETYCGRTFASASRTQTIRLPRWRERLILDRTPVVSIASVAQNGEALTADEIEIEDSGAGFLLRVDAAGCSLGWCGKVVVTYVAGYASTPADVERCVLDLCVRAYHGRGRDPLLRSERILDVIDQSWMDTDKVEMRGGLPVDVADRLCAYRVVSV
ncbi:hypothetical protein [Arenibaculum pallidiluteum]|uniref:hypothetical protein n=1 Tax=Arenibaculum pallidiluteum TaxID=2812559 RepID=UPI001A96FFE3|nr:hypothetical protein [Arenibaculum pallidiluteum]